MWENKEREERQREERHLTSCDGNDDQINHGDQI